MNHFGQHVQIIISISIVIVMPIVYYQHASGTFYHNYNKLNKVKFHP